jgi:hypothetical protein
MENLIALVIAVGLPLLCVPVLQRLERKARLERNARVVVLDPDLAEVFPDSESVNRALRGLAAAKREQQR